MKREIVDVVSKLFGYVIVFRSRCQLEADFNMIV